MDGKAAADCSRIEKGNIATASVGAAGILNLPNELLEMIMAELPCADQTRMRRVCRKFDQMFPSVYRNPVVQYTTHHDSVAVGRARGLTRLRSIIRSVTFSTTRTLTIIQPADCHLVINAAAVRDLSLRCPSLKRLILKCAPDYSTWNHPVHLKLDAVQEVPADVELELHNVRLEVEEWFAVRLHGIFKGPFGNWTARYLGTHLRRAGFFQPLPGDNQNQNGPAFQHLPNAPQANFPPIPVADPVVFDVDPDYDDVIFVDEFHNPAPAVFPEVIDVDEDG